MREVAAVKGTSPLKVLRGKPKKELSKATVEKRKIFCRGRERRSWKFVMFTDRKKFLFSYPGTQVSAVTWAAKGEQRTAHTVNHPYCVNVYAGLTVHGVTKLHIVSGTSKHKSVLKNKRGQVAKNITQHEYAHVLRETLLPEGQRIFRSHNSHTWCIQQDNDPSHKVARDVIMQFNEENKCSISLLPGWPPSSPDLSPIENLWGIVQGRMDKKGCKTFDEFKEALHKEWNSVTRTEASNLIHSVRSRIDKCLQLSGDKIGC